LLDYIVKIISFKLKFTKVTIFAKLNNNGNNSFLLNTNVQGKYYNIDIDC